MVKEKKFKLSGSSLALILFAVGSAATGQLMLRHGMKLAAAAASQGGSLAVKAATSPWVLGGLAIFAVASIAWLTTLSRVPLSIAYPFNAIGFIAILAMSALILNEQTNLWTWVGTSFVVVGLIVVVATKPS